MSTGSHPLPPAPALLPEGQLLFPQFRLSPWRPAEVQSELRASSARPNSDRGSPSTRYGEASCARCSPNASPANSTSYRPPLLILSLRSSPPPDTLCPTNLNKLTSALTTSDGSPCQTGSLNGSHPGPPPGASTAEHPRRRVNICRAPALH